MASARVLKTTRLASMAFAACLALNGCDVAQKTRAVVDQRAEEAKQTLETTSKTPHALAYDPLTVTNKVWGGNTATRMQRGMPLPPRYESVRGVTLVSAEPMSITDIASAISAQTGIPIRLTSLNLPGRTTPGASAVTASFSPTGSGLSPMGGSSSGASSGGSGDMPVSYEGPLSGLLDRMSAYFGISWRYDGSAINISRYETRIFTVEAMPGSQEVNEGMQDDSSSGSGGGGGSGSGGSSGGGGGATQNTTNTITQNSKTVMELKYWDELKDVLGNIVSDGKVSISPTMGTVTVTTTPDVMATVADYLAKENKRLSHQIAINVQIYSVDLTQTEDFNVAFSGFLKNLSKFSGLNYTSAAAPASAMASEFGALSIAILNGPNDPTAHAGDIFSALSTIGDTSEVAQFPMTTLNNRPVSRRVGTDTAYIQSYNQNITTSTASSVSTAPITATIHDGFSLQLTPRLLDDGRILLQYSLSLIGLQGLNPTTVGTGANAVQIDLPVTNNRIFVQQSMLRSGQTLMIGGVDQEKLSQNKNGVGSPDNFLLGGGQSTSNDHLMLFMALTPQVMDLSAGDHG